MDELGVSAEAAFCVLLKAGDVRSGRQLDIEQVDEERFYFGA